MSLRDKWKEYFSHGDKVSLKERVKKLEDMVAELEEASNIRVDVIKPNSYFDISRWTRVNKVLRELIEKLGYELIYRDKVIQSSCIRKKKKDKPIKKDGKK